MGNPHSRPEDRLRHISREVSSFRSSMRTSRQNISKDKKEFIVASLAKHSSEVSSMNGKVKRKNIDEALKNISEAMEQVLQIDPVELDAGAVESDSFINMPLNQRRSNSLGSLRSTKKSPRDQVSENRSSVPTLRDIEAKVSELKTQISTAIDNKDSKQLRVYQQTIKVLAEDLEMIHTEKDTPLEKRKESVDKKIISLYHKVSKALNELKKDFNLRNQSRQYKKDQALKELAEIEVHLAENESLLDKLIKEKNSSDFATIRNNIVESNQRLAKVDIVDNEVKERVVLLSQKLTETVKTLDRVMAKREFDSKFSKSLETYERIVRNFDAHTNADDTVNHLQSLRNSIQNLEEINDTTKNRKRELLQNINDQLHNFNEALQRDSDKQIVDQIVEDNVILRKKIKSTDREHTLIDQFINYWNNVKSNFDMDAYSHLSLLRIDSVLEEMQQSINEVRIKIALKCDTNPPSNLLRKHSQSVPKLDTRKSYGSNRSLDQLESKLIKTKAKMYNISPAELHSVEKQQQKYANNRFSKIEEIKLQVHYIKEKIDDSHNKNLLREKLEHYRKNLGDYVYDSNKTVQNNAILVSNEIDELLHKLVLADFKERIEILSKRVHSFNGTKYDKEFDEMKDTLIKMQLNLENFNISTQYQSLLQEKSEILEELGNSLETLQEKGTYYRKHEDENVKQIKVRLQELSDKVKRFSGTYKGVLYNKIERELNKLLLDIGEHVEDKVWVTEITKETERLLKILEQRSSLAQSFRAGESEQLKSEGQVSMTKIKRDLYNIKIEIDRTPESNVEAFIGLQSRLDLVHFELGQIAARSNENLAKEKEIFSNEAQTLKNVVDAKVALGQQPMVQWPDRRLEPETQTYPKTDMNKEMEQFENAFIAIKQGITAPNSEQDLHTFYKLAQDIKNLQDKLHNYKFIRGSDLHTRQSNLLNEMQLYINALEKGAIDVDYVINIERKLDDLENLFGSGQEYDLQSMAKELQAMQKNLQEHHISASNEVLNSRKSSVQQKTDDLVQKLKEMQDNETKQLIADTKRLDDIEEKVGVISPQITSFIGLKKDLKYYELNETTTRLILVLDKIDTENGALQKRKIKLLKDLHALGKILDERAQQTNDITSLEQGLDEVATLLQNYSGQEEEIKVIKSKMEAIKRHLHGLHVNNDLITRKNACIETFSVLFNKTMTLTVLTPQITSIAPQSRIDQSSGYPSQTSSSYNTITEQNSAGYLTRIYKFTTTTVGGPPRGSGDDKLDEIEAQISMIESAANVANDIDQLQTFDDALVQFTNQIGNLKYTKESPQYPQVIKLYQKIENLTDFIEEKMQNYDTLKSISKEVDEISHKMETTLTYEQINQLDERLIQLQVTLGKMNSVSLKSQIDACMLRIIMYIQTIAEYRASVQSTPV